MPYLPQKMFTLEIVTSIFWCSLRRPVGLGSAADAQQKKRMGCSRPRKSFVEGWGGRTEWCLFVRSISHALRKNCRQDVTWIEKKKWQKLNFGGNHWDCNGIIFRLLLWLQSVKEKWREKFEIVCLEIFKVMKKKLNLSSSSFLQQNAFWTKVHTCKVWVWFMLLNWKA